MLKQQKLTEKAWISWANQRLKKTALILDIQSRENRRQTAGFIALSLVTVTPPPLLLST